MKTGVGLYIGTERICVVQVGKKGDKLEIVSSADIDWSGGTSEASLKADLSKRITEAFQTASVKPNQVMSGLSFNAVAARYFEMPLFPKTERNAAIRYEAQKYLSFGTEELFSTHEETIDKTNRRMKVMFLAAKKNTVLGHADIVQSAGVPHAHPKPAFFLLGRLIARSAGLSKDNHLILDFNQDGNMTIFVFKGDVMLLTRSCSILRDGQPNLETMEAELHLTFNFFARSFKEDAISSIVLSPNYQGDFAPWAAALKTEFDLPCRISYPGNVFGVNKPMTTEMSLAAALALNGLEEPSRYQLTAAAIKPLSPTSFADGQKNRVKKASIFAFGAVLILVALIHMGLSTILKKGQRGITNQLTMRQLEEKEKELQEKSIAFASLLGNRTFLTEKMNELVQNTPPNSRFTSVEYHDEIMQTGKNLVTLILKWEAPGINPDIAMTDANRFLAELKKSPAFMKGFKRAKMSVYKTEEGAKFSAEFIPQGEAS